MLPRRIGEYDVEPAVTEYLGELQGPVKEGLEVRKSASDSGETTIDGVARQVFGKPCRRDGRLVGLQRLKKRSGPKIASLLLPLPGGAGALALVQIFLTMDRARRVVGNFVQSAGLAVEVLQHRVRIPPLKISGPPALLAVPACQLACCRLVVAFERVEGLVWDAGLEDVQVEHAHQRVAGPDPVIEERQRLVGRVALQPEGH